MKTTMMMKAHGATLS